MSNFMRSLDDHFCFETYVTSRSIQRLYQPLLKKKKLTYPQYLVLVVLYEKGSVTVNELGRQLDLGSGTLTPLLKRMEVAGLIKRVRSKADERVVNLTLTSNGTKTREDMSNLPDLLVEKSDLTENDWSTLTSLMNKLSDSLN